MTSLWILRPGKGLGPIELGAHWSEYANLGFLEAKTSDESAEKQYEDVSNTIRVSVEDGVVSSIEATSVCLYRGVNLIGLDVAALERVVGYEPSSIDGPFEYENGDVQHFRNYDALDMYVLVEDDRVVLLACFSA